MENEFTMIDCNQPFTSLTTTNLYGTLPVRRIIKFSSILQDDDRALSITIIIYLASLT